MVYLLLKCDSLQASVGTHCVFQGPVVLSGGSTRCPMTVRELCAALTCRSPGSWSCTSWWHERYAAYDMRGFSRATTLSLCGFPVEDSVLRIPAFSWVVFYLSFFCPWTAKLCWLHPQNSLQVGSWDSSQTLLVCLLSRSFHSPSCLLRVMSRSSALYFGFFLLLLLVCFWQEGDSQVC